MPVQIFIKIPHYQLIAYHCLILNTKKSIAKVNANIDVGDTGLDAK